MIFIKIPGRIPSKKNSRRVFNGRLVTNEAYKAWCKKSAWLLVGVQRLKLASSVRLVFYMPDNRRCDLTNKAESVMDLLVENCILEDDSWQVTGQIVLTAQKIDKENPRVEIYIKEKTDDEEHFI